MARRRKLEKEKGYEFKIPEFDEKAFVRKEKRNTKVAFLSFCFALFIAGVSLFLWSGMSAPYRWPLILMFGVFMSPFLRYFMIKLNIDVSDFGKKEWAGTFFTYFLTWLMVFTILVNPPFYDDAPPHVELALLPCVQEPGGSIIIAAYIADNAGIREINLTIIEPGGGVIYPSYLKKGNVYIWNYSNPLNLIGDFKVKLTVEDVNNHVTKLERIFSYSKDAIKLIYPRNGTKVDSATPIRFYIDKNVSDKFLPICIVNNETINLTRSGNFYETSPIYEGWIPNSNVSIRVILKVRHCFNQCLNNTVVDSSFYTFSTENDPSIGSEEGPKAEVELPKPKRFTLIPGFDFLLLAVAIVIAMMMRKMYDRD